MSCGMCNKSVRGANNSEVKCIDCNNQFHGNCVSMKVEEIKFLIESGKSWRCDGCTRNKRLSMSMDTPIKEGQITLEKLAQMLTNVSENIKSVEKSLGDSIQSCHESVGDVLEKVKKQESQLKVCLDKIETQSTEIIALKKENEELRRAISDIQQYTRSNCLELHNFPQEENEDLLGVVKSVSKALGHTITDLQIDNCHRLPTREKDKVPPIIIKLTRRIDKEELLKRRRVMRNFSTRHMDLPTDIPLYLNESLSPENRKVLALARAAKKEKDYKYLWIRNGKILMRKSEGQPVISLSSVSDISKL
ncbi:uncharacterized protein LOC111062685 [Nilaparvata lugens]|uniref:uncharacterized protein LOC111055945 n=1 Tax=Nilaparvata lugens TaxID=108931 RepID=UPI00193DDA36|nr:uncharacterized protein LOC111055945 [Nilaparvata lugens]XP_022206070.2 uncharacterized protein LOC111062685 [Nilaparvata lugens]